MSFAVILAVVLLNVGLIMAFGSMVEFVALERQLLRLAKFVNESLDPMPEIIPFELVLSTNPDPLCEYTPPVFYGGRSDHRVFYAENGTIVRIGNVWL